MHHQQNVSTNRPKIVSVFAVTGTHVLCPWRRDC